MKINLTEFEQERTVMHFTIEQRVEYFKKYYEGLNERPLLGFFLESEFPLHRYQASKNLPTHRPLTADDFIVEDYLSDYDRLFEFHESAGGNFIYAASAFWGVPWLEAALGCPIFADTKSGSIHSEPPKDFTNSANIPDFSVDNPWIKKMVEFLDVTAEHSEGRYPLATTRMRGIADLVAALYGNDIFIFKFLENPQQVKELCSKLTDYWIKFARIQLEHIPMFYGGVGSFYYNMWAPADSVWHQEDAAALLNPELYEEFILPCDKKIADSFGGCFMHMHPTGFYPYKQLLDTNMTCLELHIDAGGPNAEQLFNVHKEILEHKPLLIWGEIPDNGLDWIFDNLPHKGLAIMTVVDNPEQASAIWQRYME